MYRLHYASVRATLGFPLAVVVVLVFFAFAFSPYAKAAVTTIDVAVGTWEGRLEGIPAVTLKLKRNGDGLGGSVVFYAVQDDGSGPAVTAKSELPLVDTRFHGERITFGVDFQNRVIQFELNFLKEGEAEFRRFIGDHPSVKLIKQD